MSRRYLLVLAGLAASLSVGCKKSAGAQELPPALGSGAPALPELPAVEAAGPEQGAVTNNRELRGTGTTHPIREAELGPKASGVLAAVLVDEGDLVKKGQPLFRLEATNVALQVKQAQAALAQARVALTQADLDFERTKTLNEQGAISPATWDQVRLGRERAQVAVQQAEVAVSTARAYAADTTVTAPFGGVVAAKNKTAGETVTMMPPTTVLVLQDLATLEVRIKLAESALTRIKAGQPITVKFPSLGVERSVSIERINPSVDALSRTVEIVALLPNQDRSLKAGMLVDVTFPQHAADTAAPSPAPSASSSPAKP